MTEQKKLFTVKNKNNNIDMNVDEAYIIIFNHHYYHYNKKSTGSAHLNFLAIRLSQF